MMKIGILTHYNVSSHGALLQLYAMKKVLEDMGHTVKVLSYNKNFDFISEEEKKHYSASFKNILFYLKEHLLKDGLSMLFYQYRKQKILNNFRIENFDIIPYIKADNLDCVVVGSDEVFSLENGVNFVMFGHGITSKKIISYAPSFGQTDIARIKKFGCEDLLSSGFSRFSSISVRDFGSLETVKSLIGKEVPIVCDPALLYDFRIDKQSCITKERYIVVYSYQSNFKETERISKIKEFAQKNNCKLWSVGVHYKWCDRKINCDPLSMLRVFAGAQAVITDTFHGTISSYIAKTPMAVFVRKNNNVKLDNLLNIIGLNDRKVNNAEELETVLSNDIDFKIIEEKVAEQRVKSGAYLKQALQSN